uniref:Reverse transcriptase domain-containing protein n=1 Tax=Haplochromis burtoni TaxID=8153 RepID=A0A3Q3C7D3_HAPBU
MHSTESALLRIFNDIFLSCDSGESVILILLDLTAAFDTVDHEILISRLEQCVSITGVALKWFRSYLTKQTFSVRLGNCESSRAPLSHGVPQGSILGPILFSLYLLPLGSIFRKHRLSFHCYADDCQIYVPLRKKDGSSVNRLQICLEDVKSWLALNFLCFNVSKTEVMVFRPASTAVPYVDLQSLKSFCKPEIVNLGFKMDPEFKLESQIGLVVRSSFFHLRQLAKIKHFLTRQQFETVIHAFVTVRLDYCNSLDFGVSRSSVFRLQLVQNAAARLLTGTRRYEHITPVLYSLHWLPVHFRIHFKLLLFVFKCLSNAAPVYLSELPYIPSRSLRSADQLLLSVPRTNRKLRGDRAFAVAAPKLWNELPLHVRQAPSLSVFKSRLKTYLFTLAFSTAGLVDVS